MARIPQSFYFELSEDDRWFGQTDSYRSRLGMVPVDVFKTGAEMVSALAMARRDRDFSPDYRQQAIAKVMNVQPAALSRLERESELDPPREPTLAKLKAYAAAMGYDVWLVCVPKRYVE